MLLRIIAAIMFAAAGTVAGSSRAEKLKNDLEICRETGELLRRSSVYIRFQGLNVYELSSKLRECPELHRLTFLEHIPDKFIGGENFHECWRSALSSQENIPDEERRLLLDFGEIIGTSDITGQMSSIRAVEAELDPLEKRRRDAFLRKGRLYRSTGTLLGIMAGILII